MPDGKVHRPQRERLRPRLYEVAIYLVATILLLQVFFCLSVFFLRPYAKSKTPEGILQQERIQATDWFMGLILRSQQAGKNEEVKPRPATNAPTAP